MNGSLSKLAALLPKLLVGRPGGVAEAEQASPWRSLHDLDEPSSGEKAVKRVSGVPLNDSAPPLEDLGDEGLSRSRTRAMASVLEGAMRRLSEVNWEISAPLPWLLAPFPWLDCDDGLQPSEWPRVWASKR